MRLDARHKFFAASALFFAATAALMIPQSVPPRMTAILSGHRGSITSLDIQRNTSFTRTYRIDTLDFPEGSALKHRSLGPLGADRDFFLDIHGRFIVNRPGEYRFVVSSDDGFRLRIDGKTVAEYLGDRPMQATEGRVSLSEGSHRFDLSYFQGFGHLGLIARYGRPGGRLTVMGDSTADIEFPLLSAKTPR